MRLGFLAFASYAVLSQSGLADACQDRFVELMVNGNADHGPTRVHVTQEIVGGSTSTNYHYSDGNGNGLTEMIDPASSPWSLFIGDNMYSSNDKGESWSFMSSYNAQESRAAMMAAMQSDTEAATGVTCGSEDLDGTSYEVLEGTYVSSTVSGAEIYEKLWVNSETDFIARSYRHLKMTGFESKVTQVIEPAPDFVLPDPG